MLPAAALLATTAPTPSGSSETWLTAAWCVAAYLVGSIPVGFLMARRRGVDIRAHGSGNIGATNVTRVLGPRLGRICLLLDICKGLVPTLAAGLWLGVAGSLTVEPVAMWWWLAVAGCTIAGHMFPIWLRFKGGKGVATGLGAMLGVFPLLALAALGSLLVWLTSVKLTRMVGISSCLAALSLPAWVALVLAADDGVAGLRRGTPAIIVSGLLAALVIFKHRTNLARTFAGTESRVPPRPPPAPPGAAPPNDR